MEQELLLSPVQMGKLRPEKLLGHIVMSDRAGA